MECNKDEAFRSKSIAEAKFSQHDLGGAKKFALKARQLFPELDGLPQFISVLDVHVAAQEKLPNGETNWYGILQVDSTADESTIRKQYRKLALLLHPDKNKSVGAEAAFKHISEAWGVLSDKAKKAVHDMRRNAKATQSSKRAQYKESRSSNGHYNVPHPPPATQPQPQTHPPPPAPPQPSLDMKTFWTACPACRMQFEYQRHYENKNLCCPLCYKAFVAREASFINGTTLWPPEHQQSFRTNAGRPDHQGNGDVNGLKSSTFVNINFPFPHFGNVAAAHAFHQPQMKEMARKEDKEVQAQKHVSKNEQKKREKEQKQAKLAAQAKESFDRLIARSKDVIGQTLSSDGASNQLTGGKKHAAVSLDHETQDDSFSAKKARVEQGSLDEQVSKAELPKENQDFKCSNGETMEGIKLNVASGTGFSKLAEDLVDNATSAAGEHPLQGDSTLNKMPQTAKQVPTTGEIGLNPIPEAADAMNVPDADFYDFDKDRTEYHFLPGQIWAAYDDDDGMPRYYARIGKVISRQPFKLQMSWLEARSPSEETVTWLNSGFSYTCGEFKLGETIASEHINTFSHLMSFEKGHRGGFKIYPRKGDVWAVYKDWDTLKSKDAKHGYEMVEVLTDHKDEVGVQVGFLGKIEGFKTLFKRKLGVQDVQWISSKELRRFSHLVPAHKGTAEQVLGIQEGCWELDPASTPMDLITGPQV